ncbi:hypothetical protein [Salinimicrobium sediminilitoris]|uniref:hypothetical protein n=1 Tax=Salinimicrobium sediminilitoris TaxID=2876715 RepID=UPI001E63BF24|nr:hypothetical protein [Salinimicrobium sediminilitoris]MCC8359655.1 hypothetical protein [Salinimicrobium sediminilitoris]
MKNLKLNYIIVVLGLILMVSCKDEEKTAEATPQETTETTSKAEGTEEVQVNPAHGLPGHRCDLPVGAPLNASAGSTPNPTPTSQLPSTSVSPIRVDQTPSVNPAHGEPGHDCSIPVGAPLNQ